MRHRSVIVSGIESDFADINALQMSFLARNVSVSCLQRHKVGLILNNEGLKRFLHG